MLCVSFVLVFFSLYPLSFYLFCRTLNDEPLRLNVKIVELEKSCVRYLICTRARATVIFVFVMHAECCLFVFACKAAAGGEQRGVSPATKALRRGNRRLTRNESRYHSGKSRKNAFSLHTNPVTSYITYFLHTVVAPSLLRQNNIILRLAIYHNLYPVSMSHEQNISKFPKHTAAYFYRRRACFPLGKTTEREDIISDIQPATKEACCFEIYLRGARENLQ